MSSESLSDYTDRLSRIAKIINTTTSATVCNPASGPFTTAVLHTPLEDLIREVDTSELGLFTIQTRRGQKEEEEIGRVKFGGATPLKKGKVAHGKRKEVDIEPEVYVQAALKYLDRFQSVRPMPRARAKALSILEQLSESRSNIQVLSSTLEKMNSEPLYPLSPKSRANGEERRIAELQKMIEEVKKRVGDKESVLKQQKARKKPPAFTKGASSKDKTKLAPSTPPPSTLPEDDPWVTPAQAGRVLTFSATGGLCTMEGDSLLLDGEKDMDMLADVSMTTEEAMSPVSNLAKKLGATGTDNGGELCDDESILQDWNASEDVDEDREDEEDGDDSKTITLPKLHHEPELLSHSPAPPPPFHPDEPATPSLSPTRTPNTTLKSTPSTSSKSKSKIKINTQVEIIIAKVWSTVGELIMPGHPYRDEARNRPPKAKETLAHLQALSILPPNPPSPSISSISTLSATNNQPTQQGILTAQLILALLSSASQKMSLKAVKGMLAERGAGASGTRVIYGCVAKRLIKIERGSGEQVVMFDI